MENLKLLKIHTVEEHSTVTGLWLTISFPLHNKPKHLDTALKHFPIDWNGIIK